MSLSGMYNGTPGGGVPNVSLTLPNPLIFTPCRSKNQEGDCLSRNV
ncbi:hypothetical protein pdam_00021967 [Pocillopora damicornis]|uniref:Uncharacterized protein n=1 Tax=Pocillopora damicornis TaxID=46731 RepID=A0A3M6UTI6_POCDA|nr:hypothetical protein pdam_00021967 [Pocillopora damicornis]